MPTLGTVSEYMKSFEETGKLSLTSEEPEKFVRNQPKVTKVSVQKHVSDIMMIADGIKIL